MEITEKVAYIKGLAEGMELDTDKKIGKLLSAIIDVLDDMALEIEDLKDAQEELGDAFQFVKENTMCSLLSYKGSVFTVEVPNFVDLVVTETEPGVKGDTATNVTKPATVETGTEVKVPLFINEGDRIQIDTRTGEYLGRAKG